jgi:hypothetical protein
MQQVPGVMFVDLRFPLSKFEFTDPQLTFSILLHFLHSRFLRTLLVHTETLNENLCVIRLIIDPIICQLLCTNAFVSNRH